MVVPVEAGGGSAGAGFRIGGVLYAVTVEGIRSLYVENGVNIPSRVEPSVEIVGAIHELRDELRDTIAVARGAVPRLTNFSVDWGRRLLPESLLTNPPDVLVAIP